MRNKHQHHYDTNVGQIRPVPVVEDVKQKSDRNLDNTSNLI